jgi:hypothetical protein
MGFNRRKMEDQRRQAAEKEAAARRATDAQVLEDAEPNRCLDERQARRMPMLFSPTIGAVFFIQRTVVRSPEIIGMLLRSAVSSALEPRLSGNVHLPRPRWTAS